MSDSIFPWVLSPTKETNQKKEADEKEQVRHMVELSWWVAKKGHWNDAYTSASNDTVSIGHLSSSALVGSLVVVKLCSNGEGDPCETWMVCGSREKRTLDSLT
jgi:hypothetical protein